jgi:hypothetical protein
MRKGVADFWRNFQVGIAANRRYLDALAAAPLKGESVAAIDALCRPHTKAGRTYARFNPLTPADLALFRALLSGEHAINGFRNRDSQHASTGARHTIDRKLTDDANDYHA